jgi:hypothetical protein
MVKELLSNQAIASQLRLFEMASILSDAQDLPEKNVLSSAVLGSASIAFSLLTANQISALVSFLHKKA